MPGSCIDIRKKVLESEEISEFQRRVYLALLDVPAGETVTYGELARRIGCRSAQAVGQALRRNPFAPDVPCHRVVGSTGIGGFHGHKEGEMIDRKRRLLAAEGATLALLLGLTGCNNNAEIMNYGADKAFLERNNIETVELVTADGNGRVLLVPAWQGRVMTSTTGGDEGKSYGWINHKFIASGEVNPQFNSFGGEERFWIGPEGGPFSYYFKPGEEQVYANWLVPKVIDTEGFELLSSCAGSAVLARRATLANASGNQFDIEFRRVVSIQDPAEVLGVSPELLNGAKALAYSTGNSITNLGGSAWDRQSGMPSIWLLGCFTPTPTTTVFIPYETGYRGSTVKTDYFGELPADRISVRDGFVFFRIDGAFRSKIGLPKGSAKGLVGSYDSAGHVLNILKYTTPEGDCEYVNSQWGHQEDNFGGDVVNSYNDGPTDTGTIMGPFYEIETSSPAAALAPGQTLTHVQYTLHIEADEPTLDRIVRTVFGISLSEIHL